MQIDVIDHVGEILYRATRKQVYEKFLPHRIVHILAKDENKIFIQKRAKHVKYLPGYYCTSAGGHVEAGETPLDAAKRELKEELGLESEPKMIAEFIFNNDGHHRRIFVYQTTLNEKMQFNNKEISGGFFVNKEELLWLTHNKLHPQLLPCVNYIWPNLL